MQKRKQDVISEPMNVCVLISKTAQICDKYFETWFLNNHGWYGLCIKNETETST